MEHKRNLMKNILILSILFLGNNAFSLTNQELTCMNNVKAQQSFETIQKSCSGIANINFFNEEKNTPLHYAALYNNKEEALYFLKLGAFIDAKNQWFLTPLHMAAANNATKVIPILIQNRANIESIDADGNTPVFLASDYGSLEAMEMLSDYGAKLDNRNKTFETPFLVAASKGHIAIMQFLQSKGVNIKAISYLDGKNALSMAASENRVEAMDVLLKMGFDINNNKNYRAETPLYDSVSSGAVDSIKFLLENNAEVDKANFLGLTPLFLACKMGREDIVKILLDHKANPNYMTKQGITPKDVAYNLRRRNLYRILDISEK